MHKINRVVFHINQGRKDGRQKTENGRWKMENGKLRPEN
jgi:hypothetical protein